MSNTKQNNRDKNGRFVKGNKAAKKHIDKELAQHATWQELYHASNLLTGISVTELKQMVSSGKLADESILTYSILSKASKGDFKPVQFLIEMIVGKAKQQIDNTSSDGSLKPEYKFIFTEKNKPDTN